MLSSRYVGSVLLTLSPISSHTAHVTEGRSVCPVLISMAMAISILSEEEGDEEYYK